MWIEKALSSHKVLSATTNKAVWKSIVLSQSIKCDHQKKNKKKSQHTNTQKWNKARAQIDQKQLKQRELIALGWRHTRSKGHNNTDLNRLQKLSPRAWYQWQQSSTNYAHT